MKIHLQTKTPLQTKVFPRLLRRWRRNQGLKQCEAARLLRVSPATMSLWEAGLREPTTWKNIASIVRVTGIQLDEVA